MESSELARNLRAKAHVRFRVPRLSLHGTIVTWLNRAKPVKIGPYTMKRRTFRRLRAHSETSRETLPVGRDSVEPSLHHHNVYVVLLKPGVARLRAVRLANPGRNPKKPCVYVGLTGLSPDQRFANHLQGIKASPFVQRYAVRLLPELYTHLNPMPYEAALQMELDLAEDLRRLGYTVTGGH